jgi:LysM repeat protein
MKSKIFVVFIFLLISVISGSCILPASTAPETFKTNTPNVPFPIATNAQSVHAVVSGTQTAQAMQAGRTSTISLSTLPVGSTGLPTFSSLYTNTPGLIAINTPTKTVFPYATSTPGRPTSYTVHQGEYCYCLARRFDVNPDVLTSSNPVCSSTVLEPGTTINIPQNGNWPGDRARFPHPTTYSVRGGDTIYAIACYFGDVDPNIIIAVNGLQSPYTLTVGQSLQIP